MPRASSFILAWLLVASSLLTVVPAAEAASVTPQSATLPEGMVGASAAMVEGQTYIFGGRNAAGAYSERVYKYDPATDTLTPLGTLPSPVASDVQGPPGRYSGTTAVVGTKIYYFGGAQLVEQDINGDGTKEKIPKASRDVFVLDTVTNSLRMTNDKLPLGTWGMSSTVVNGKVYLFGGFTFDLTDLPNTGRHDWVLRFDPSQGEPTAASGFRFRELNTKLSYPVQDSAAALVGRRVLIMGGLSDHHNDTNPCPTYSFYNQASGREETRQIEVCLTKRIMSFDPEQEFVIGVAGELPYRAQFISAATVRVNGQDRAYIPGALLSDGTSSSSILEVTFESGTPQTRVLLPSLPKGTFGQAVATDGKTIVIAGGRHGTDKDLSKEIIRFDPRVTAPWAPRSATAVDISGGVRLSWEAPSYNGDGVITGYRVYRSSAGEEETKLADVAGLSYEDKTVRPGTDYVWRIVAVNSCGVPAAVCESATSARVSRSSGIATPGAVSAFEGFPGNQQALLRWRPPTDIGGSSITGYRVMRNDVLLTSLPPDRTDYVDNTVQNGETYLYRVRAVNAKGDGALSDTLRITPALVPPAPTNLNTEIITTGSNSAVRISWFAAESVNHYVVYRSARPGVLGTALGNVSNTNFVDESVERGQTYYYAVVSTNDVGRSPPSPESAVSLVRKPGVPQNVLAFGQEGEIRVSWTPPEDTGDAPAGLLRYYVSRATGSEAPRIVKTDIETNLFIDRLVTPGVSYTYTVTTLNPMASDPSAASTAASRALVNKPPVAVVAANPNIAEANDPIEIDASNSGDPDGTIKSYLFDFGDGTDSVSTPQAVVTHQFGRNGTYNVTVIVSDDRGLQTLAYTKVIIGDLESSPQTENGGLKPPPREAPGSQTPGIPGPGPMLVLVAVALAAFALAKKRT